MQSYWQTASQPMSFAQSTSKVPSKAGLFSQLIDSNSRAMQQSRNSIYMDPEGYNGSKVYEEQQRQILLQQKAKLKPVRSQNQFLQQKTDMFQTKSEETTTVDGNSQKMCLQMDPLLIQPQSIAIAQDPIIFQPDSIKVPQPPLVFRPDTITIPLPPLTVKPEPVVIHRPPILIQPQPVILKRPSMEMDSKLRLDLKVGCTSTAQQQQIPPAPPLPQQQTPSQMTQQPYIQQQMHAQAKFNSPSQTNSMMWQPSGSMFPTSDGLYALPTQISIPGAISTAPSARTSFPQMGRTGNRL